MITGDSEQYYMSLQANVGFQPNDQQLITHFLKRKMSGHPLPVNIIIDELSFYNYSPTQLSDMYAFANQNELYFFTQIARRYRNSVVPQRSTGNGFWKSVGPYEDIKQGNEIIGVKKSLQFYAGSRKDSTKSNWTMVEYLARGTLSEAESQHILCDWVLCKVYEKKSNAENVPDSSNQGNPTEGDTGKQLHPSIITFPVEDLFEIKKRQCLSQNSGQLPLAISSYRRPCLPVLPLEVILEILSWLPVKSLVRFKCVCRKWYSMFQDEKFVAKHRDRASPLQLPYINKFEGSNLVSLYDENFKLIRATHGLFMEESIASHVFRIRNFAMHQVLYLPHACDADTSTMDFILNLSTGQCKVACFYSTNDGQLGTEVGFKVLTVGKDCQWRPRVLPNQNDKTELRQHGKYVLKRHSLEPNQSEGADHTLEIIKHGQEVYIEVQSLDMWTECFITTRLPQGVFGDLKKVFVFRWYECLAVGDIAGEVLNALVFEDFKECKWSKNLIRVPLKFLESNPSLKNQIRPVRVELGLLVLHQGGGSLLKYDMKRRIMWMITNTEPWKTLFSPHPPSLVTFNGMRLKRVKAITRNGD